MQIDWIIAITVFLVFTAWAFSYYSTLFPKISEPLESAVFLIQDKLLDWLEIDVYKVPIRFSSTNSTTSSVLYFDFLWPTGTKNSTTILKDSTQLLCEISDNRIYWQDDLDEGVNYFSMEFANVSTTLNCTANLNKSIVNQTTPWAEEKKQLISQSKINEMQATSYDDFKDSLGITMDFRIEIETNTSTTSYGKTIPSDRNVWVVVTSNKIWESGKIANVSIAVW